MGTELEGKELQLLPWLADTAQGLEKMSTGSSNLLSKTVNQTTPPLNNLVSNQPETPVLENVDFAKILDGASQIDNALPDKSDIRDAANATELVGDSMVMGSPLTGPVAPVTAAAGGVIGTVGFLTNVTLDLAEGNLESAATRVIIEAGSAGMGSLVKQADGGKVATELTNTVLARTGEGVQSSITKKEEIRQ